MKVSRILSTAFLMAIGSITLQAQTPESIQYQAALRNSSGQLLSGSAVTVRFTILDGSASGTELYRETHSATTTDLGLVNLQIGGGTVVSGVFEDIDWADDARFLKTEVKQGSGSFVDLGTQKMLSVPYALHAKNTGAIAGKRVSNATPSSGQVLKFNGTVWAPAAAGGGSGTPGGAAGGDLSGTYPNPTVGSGKITAAKIANNAVTTDKIANNAVTGVKIPTNAITAAKIANNAVTTDKIANNAVTGVKIPTNAITAAKIANNAVTTDKIANNAVSAAKLHAMGASSGQVLKYNGSAWAPATDANTTYWTQSSSLLHKSSSSSWTRINLGFGTASATGNYSTTLGQNTTASGSYSTAMGYASTASGTASTATGSNTTASGNYATAIGNYSIASGTDAFASGLSTTASGSFTTAMGTRVSTNNHQGSFIIGDYTTTPTPLTSSADNQMTMRFRGGYHLYSNGAATIGVSLAANGASWSFISDSTKKENFLYPQNDFLTKISSMRIGSWNYKGQDKKHYRHYGPMAQDFYANFGHDGIGTIGNDTTIASADMDGVMMIAIQQLIAEKKALEKEVAALKANNKELTAQVSNLNEAQEESRAAWQSQQETLRKIQAQIDRQAVPATESLLSAMK